MVDRESGPKGGKSGVRHEDRKLWRAYTRDVTPLGDDVHDPEIDVPPGPAQDKNRITDGTSSGKQPTSGPQGREGGYRTQRSESSRSVQLDRRSDDKLRRGKLPIEARLDLHGHTREAARHALAQFLRESYASGKRCVLVITGRGALGAARDEDESDQPAPGVLRRSVPEWLESPPLSDIVIRHYPARAKDGGDGALYILLKRQRI